MHGARTHGMNVKQLAIETIAIDRLFGVTGGAEPAKEQPPEKRPFEPVIGTGDVFMSNSIDGRNWRNPPLKR